jgi:hypothetical protein
MRAGPQTPHIAASQGRTSHQSSSSFGSPTEAPPRPPWPPFLLRLRGPLTLLQLLYHLQGPPSWPIPCPLPRFPLSSQHPPRPATGSRGLGQQRRQAN